MYEHKSQSKQAIVNLKRSCITTHNQITKSDQTTWQAQLQSQQHWIAPLCCKNRRLSKGEKTMMMIVGNDFQWTHIPNKEQKRTYFGTSSL